MDTSGRRYLHVNWTRFLDGTLLLAGFVSVASVAIQLI